MSDTITITGNIAAEPERRQTSNGTPLTTFRVGSSQRHYDRARGEWVQTATNWYRVSAFRGLGDNAFSSLHRGDRVIVTGRLRLREWENDSRRGLSVEIDADGIGHDLRWGTSDYTARSRENAAAWSVPGAAADVDAPDASRSPASPDAPDASWPTVEPPAEVAEPEAAAGPF